MAQISTDIPQLKFNKMSTAKYNELKEAGQLVDNEFYITPDDETELFNGKADVDLNNVTSVGKENIVSWGMPDYSAGIDITSILKNENHTWTVPCDGFLRCRVTGNTVWVIATNDTITASLDNSLIYMDGDSTVNVTENTFVSKNIIIKAFSYTGTSAIFYPLKGVI